MPYLTDPFQTHGMQALEDAVKLGLDDQLRNLLMARFCRSKYEHGPTHRKQRALDEIALLTYRIAELQRERDVLLGWASRIPNPVDVKAE